MRDKEGRQICDMRAAWQKKDNDRLQTQVNQLQGDMTRLLNHLGMIFEDQPSKRVLRAQEPGEVAK